MRLLLILALVAGCGTNLPRWRITDENGHRTVVRAQSFRPDLNPSIGLRPLRGFWNEEGTMLPPIPGRKWTIERLD